MTAADVANGNHFIVSGKDLIIAHNSGATPRTITITSQPINGRLGTISAEAIAAGAYRIYGPFKPRGWANASREILVSANNAEVLLGVVRNLDR